MDKYGLMIEYCGKCINTHFCFPEMFEPDSGIRVIGSLDDVRNCKVKFDSIMRNEAE